MAILTQNLDLSASLSGVLVVICQIWHFRQIWQLEFTLWVYGLKMVSKTCYIKLLIRNCTGTHGFWTWNGQFRLRQVAWFHGIHSAIFFLTWAMWNATLWHFTAIFLVKIAHFTRFWSNLVKWPGCALWRILGVSFGYYGQNWLSFVAQRQNWPFSGQMARKWSPGCALGCILVTSCTLCFSCLYRDLKVVYWLSTARVRRQQSTFWPSVVLGWTCCHNR